MLFSCVLRCGQCGHTITREKIHRKLQCGGRNTHIYYRCGNSHPPDDHAKVRWREQDVEAAIVRELESIRIPDPEISDWFCESLQCAFSDVTNVQAQKRKLLAEGRTELTNMIDRLLSAYLAGMIDEAAFNSKSAQLKAEAADVERELDEADRFDPRGGEWALSVFDFSQNLGEIWRGSNFPVRREILNCVNLNRTLGDLSLVLAKRKPFDGVPFGSAERPFLKNSRGDWI